MFGNGGRSASHPLSSRFGRRPRPGSTRQTGELRGQGSDLNPFRQHLGSMDPFGRTYWVYILASRKNGTLYTGVTSDISGRVWEHKVGATGGFTTRYGVHRLVYFEMFGMIDDAIAREKSVKRWRRDWKIALIERDNPEWRDLYEEIAWQMR